MEANVLRLILLIVGVAFVAGIYFWERRKREERHIHAVRREPELSSELPAEGFSEGGAVSLTEVAAEKEVEIDFDQAEEGVRLRPSRGQSPDYVPPPSKSQAPAPAPAQVPERIPVPVWALKKPDDRDALTRELGQLDALVKESAPPRRPEVASREKTEPAWSDADVTPKGKVAPLWGDVDVVPPDQTAPRWGDVEVTPKAQARIEPVTVPTIQAPEPEPAAGEQIAFPFVAEVSKKLKARKKDKDKDKGKKRAPAEAERADFPVPSQPQPQPQPQESPLIPPKILVINVKAKREPFAGPRILDVATACGLEAGDLNIFHRCDPSAHDGRILYSMASMVEPGSFPLAAMDAFVTPGLSLFTRLPDSQDGLAMFNEMLATAERLARDLGGELQDETRSVLTRQTIEHLRGEIVEYQRRLRLVRKPA